jgi:hypothetical protein
VFIRDVHVFTCQQVFTLFPNLGAQARSSGRRNTAERTVKGAAALDRGRIASSRRDRQPFQGSEFAADLFAVDAGHATEDYATAENFFRITFPTEGLKRVLTSTLRRLAGVGGDRLKPPSASWRCGKPTEPIIAAPCEATCRARGAAAGD